MQDMVEAERAAKSGKKGKAKKGKKGKKAKKGKEGKGKGKKKKDPTVLFRSPCLIIYMHYITFCTAFSLPINHVPISAQGQWTLQVDQKPLTHQSLVIGHHPPTGH